MFNRFLTDWLVLLILNYLLNDDGNHNQAFFDLRKNNFPVYLRQYLAKLVDVYTLS